MKSNHQVLNDMTTVLMNMESFNVVALAAYAHTFRRVIANLEDSAILDEAGRRQYRHQALQIQMEIGNGKMEDAFFSLVITAQSLAADTLIREHRVAAQLITYWQEE